MYQRGRPPLWMERRRRPRALFFAVVTCKDSRGRRPQKAKPEAPGGSPHVPHRRPDTWALSGGRPPGGEGRPRRRPRSRGLAPLALMGGSRWQTPPGRRCLNRLRGLGSVGYTHEAARARRWAFGGLSARQSLEKKGPGLEAPPLKKLHRGNLPPGALGLTYDVYPRVSFPFRVQLCFIL
ncbi:unnamed protein product, partial [Amoebophrya sp. A25]|eukprot:GSA25T00000861001.1